MSPVRDEFLHTNYWQEKTSKAPSNSLYSSVCLHELAFPSSYSNQTTPDSTDQSSFNLPVQYDQLMAPTSMSQHHAIDTKPTYLSPRAAEVKLSPSEMSPIYDLFNVEEDFNQNRHSYPMKYKHPQSSRLHISTSNHGFSTSPSVPSTPYFGSYGVSAPNLSTRSDSLPSMNQSPISNDLHSTSGFNNSTRNHGLPNPGHSFRPRPMEPVEIAPKPLNGPPLRLALPNGDPFRHNPLPSLQCSTGVSSTAGARSTRQYSEQIEVLPMRRKRKTSHHSDGSIYLSGDMTDEEHIMMNLVENERHPWKEVARLFNARTGKTMKVPALQMRKKRLVERLRKWTPKDDRALLLASESLDKPTWEQLSTAMLNYGCPLKWPRETVQRKYSNMQLDTKRGRDLCRDQHRFSEEENRFAEEVENDGYMVVRHDYHSSDESNSAVSTVPMDDIRERSLSNTSTAYSIEQQIHDQLRFELAEDENWE